MLSGREIVLGVLALALLVGLAVFVMPKQSLRSTGEIQESLTPISSTEISSLVKSRGAKLTVVNFWASFCMPCREEFPHFLQAYREYRDQGVEVIFISLDFKTEQKLALEFLAEQGVDFETFIKSEKDDTFIRNVNAEWSGAIPATAFYDADGKMMAFVSQPMSFEDLEEKILTGLGVKK